MKADSRLALALAFLFTACPAGLFAAEPLPVLHLRNPARVLRQRRLRRGRPHGPGDRGQGERQIPARLPDRRGCSPGWIAGPAGSRASPASARASCWPRTRTRLAFTSPDGNQLTLVDASSPTAPGKPVPVPLPPPWGRARSWRWTSAAPEDSGRPLCRLHLQFSRPEPGDAAAQ